MHPTPVDIHELPPNHLETTSASHPRGLYLLFATEMWERFSYYGMRAVLVLFLWRAMSMDKAFASKFYGGYTSLVYLTPLIGGYISDRYWGNRRSITMGGILMALGQFLLFWSASDYGAAATHPVSHVLLYVGLGAMIIGNGFFKPNISTMVGSLYTATDKRKDAAYTIFYMGINAGSFLGNLITSLLGDKEGRPELFKWSFLACSIAMVLGTVIFNLGKDKYLRTPAGKPVGLTPPESSGINGIYALLPVLAALAIGVLWLDLNKFSIIAPMLLLATVGIAYMIFSDKSLSKADIQGVLVIFVVSFFVVFFWAAFEQAGNALTFFADGQMNRTVTMPAWLYAAINAVASLFGSQASQTFTIPASLYQNLNAFFVVTGAPLVALLWTALGKRGAEPPSPVKMALGLALLAVGYLVMCFGVTNVQPGVKVSMLFLVGLYFFHSYGELFLSPIGLSLVNKLAPAKFASLLMGVWFLANAGANYLAGYMSSLYPDPQSTGPKPVLLGFHINNLYDFFLIFVVSAAVAAAILLLISPKLISIMKARTAEAA